MGIFKKSPGRGAPTHGGSYNYKKRFNAQVTVTSNGISLPSNPSSFAGTYGGGGRPTVKLDSVTVEEGDIYSFFQKAQVTFTCFTKDAFKGTYFKMLALGGDCSISIGYVPGNGAPGDGKTFSNMFVYKFDWKLTKENYVQCTFHAMSAIPLIDQHPINTHSKLAGAGLTFKAVQTAGQPPVDVPVQSIPQYMMYLAQGSGGTATTEIEPGFSNGILVINNPLTSIAQDQQKADEIINVVNSAGGNLSADNSKIVYCTLQWFIHQLNEFYMPNDADKLRGITYRIGQTATNSGAVSGEICSSDPFNILLCGNESGNYGELSGKPVEQQIQADDLGPKANNIDSIDCSNILLSASYLASAVFGDAQMFNATSDAAKNPSSVPEKPTFTFEKLLKQIFDDIYRVTGGAVHLVTVSNPKDPADKIRYIEAMNHNDEEKPKPKMFDPFSGTQAIRQCDISCAPGSRDAYLVAMSNRVDSAGVLGVNGKTVGKASDFVNAQNAIREARQKGLSMANYSAASIDGLRQQLAKHVSSAGSTDAANGKVPHQAAQFPLNLSLITDGCFGFEFGDLITTALNPAGQDGSIGCFVITKLTHTVAQNDWTTKFDTQYMII
jgi:hypothetical protein